MKTGRLAPSEGINKSLLRTYNKKNIFDDPLRILRCFRFVSELNFDIDPYLFSLIKHHSDLLAHVSVERIQDEFRKIIRGKYALKSLLLVSETHLFKWIQKYQINADFLINQLNLTHFSQYEIQKFVHISYLIETLDDHSIKKLKFSNSEIAEAFTLRKWKHEIIKKPIVQFTESERFLLHKELEKILPAFIIYLPEKDKLEWLNRWRDQGDRLFHPTNLLNGDLIKKHIKIKDGPLLGRLLLFLSKELAFERIQNFDEAIYKAKGWFQQNAPKCD